jgi:hypothetical protein
MALFHVTVYLNVGPDNFAGLDPADPVATDTDLHLTITAPDPARAAERAFAVGNRMEADDDGRRWPSDVREVSVGDPLKVTDEPHAAAGQARFYAVASAGFHTVPEPANPIVPLAGTTATSRA